MHWNALEANAHHPEVQQRIREEIRKGTIRVVPAPGGGVKIIPLARPDPNSRSQFPPRASTPGPYPSLSDCPNP